MNNVSRATELFRQGCACSQAILAVYGEPLGLPFGQALKIASGFAGGMRMAETCGAVTGAIMVLGLRHASEDCTTRERRSKVYARVLDFLERFRKRNGSAICRELLGCDISTPEGMKQAQQQNLFESTCVKLVQDAAEILEEMEQEAEGVRIFPD
jgi:C_GCAxxG_C_C family probable redox protein